MRQRVYTMFTSNGRVSFHWAFGRRDMPWFSASENWVAAYFSDRQFSDLMSPAICCSPQTRNKEVGKIFINVKKYYLWLLKLYLFLDKNKLKYPSKVKKEKFIAEMNIKIVLFYVFFFNLCGTEYFAHKLGFSFFLRF